ncbi:MAG: replication initiator protein A [Planctomycetaceae bacterium]|nr:replication initiator protein A [Planctomycetaceae bacterium]MBV8267285.1 replication initiator protein A [Planctomycetaceae bacterium]MBV8383329.1 replication initiator protein A [Planctomycetaceae bacterium]
MHDAEQDPRRVGRDEMNLCEFPIALLTDYPSEGVKTMVFEDRHGRLTVSGSDAYGLPTAPDSDVIVGLIQLTKLRNDFTDPTVEFTRYELLRLLGWPDQKHYYQRLTESLHRWVGVTLRYDGTWWDNRRKRRVDASFHILECVILPDKNDPMIESSFTWNKIFFKSCRDGNLKRLDLDTYFSLKSAISKQLYRFLDKRFYLRPDWTFGLPELAFEHVGMSRNYAVRNIKQKLQPALEELEAIGFLEPMAAADRYTKAGRGAWNIRLVRKLPAPAEAQPAEPGPTGLERELIDRGVTAATARDLVATSPAERIRAQIEHTDWLRETKPKRVADVGAYLAEAIRKDFAPPAGFEGRAERAARETADRAALDREVEARRAQAREREERDRVRAYWEALPPERRAALDAAALAGAAPADRAAYEAAAAAPVRRLLLVGLRDALIRHRLGLPAVD